MKLIERQLEQDVNWIWRNEMEYVTLQAMVLQQKVVSGPLPPVRPMIPYSLDIFTWFYKYS